MAGDVLLANRAARDAFGADLLGRCWPEFCPGMTAETWKQITTSPENVTVEAEVEGCGYVFTHRCDPASGLVFVFGADVTELKSAQAELRESQSRLAQQAQILTEVARFPDMNPGPVLRANVDGEVLIANRAASEIFGSDLVGRRWPGLCPGLTTETWRGLVSTKDLVSVEADVKDRCYVFTHRCDPVTKLVFIYGTDITQLKLAQRALTDSQRTLAEQAEALKAVARFPDMNPGPVLRADMKGLVKLQNRAAADVFGADLVGKCWYETCPGLDEAAWRHISSTPEVVTVEAALGGRDYVFTHRCDIESRLVFIYGADITELKKAQRALTESQALLEKQAAALEAMARFPDMNPGPVLRADMKGDVLLANRSASEVFGQDLIGKSWPEVCPGLSRVRWDVIAASDRLVPLEAVVGGREYVFTHRCDQQTRLVFIFGADVTELKETQKALRQSEKLAALGRLSAGLAHELNNPAAAARRAAAQLREKLPEVERLAMRLGQAGLDAERVQSILELKGLLIAGISATRELGPLERTDLEERIATWLDAKGVEGAWVLAPELISLTIEQLDALAAGLEQSGLHDALAWVSHAAAAQELVETVHMSTASMSELVGAVKTYSHMDRAPEQEVDIHDGLESALRILSHRFKAGTRLEREYDRKLPRVWTNAGEINQVWTNLIDNALDAAGATGNVTVRTSRDGDSLRVEVCDSGPGIPEKLRARIFEPFFTTKAVGQGTGLGLDMARRIVVERCKGQIGFESKPGQTTFWVMLPLRRTESASG